MIESSGDDCALQVALGIQPKVIRLAMLSVRHGANPEDYSLNRLLVPAKEEFATMVESIRGILVSIEFLNAFGSPWVDAKERRSPLVQTGDRS